MEGFFEERIRARRELLAREDRVFNLLGYVKFAVLALCVWLVYRAFGGGAPDRVLAAGACLILAALWVFHARVHSRIRRLQGLIRLNEEGLERIGGGWRGFQDDGADFADPAHPYGCDLDLAGAGSLFQMISLARTPHGRKALANDLLSPSYSPEEIRARQEAAAELAGLPDFTDEFVLLASAVDPGGEAGRALELIQPGQDSISTPLSWLLSLLPAATVILWVLCLALASQGLLILAVTLSLVQGLLWVLGLPRLNPVLSAAAAAPYKLQRYVDLLLLLEKQSFHSPLLQELREGLAGPEASAIRALRTLNTVVALVRLRSNFLLYCPCNVLFLWDFQCLRLLRWWQGRYGDGAEGWFRALGTLESLMSLAVPLRIWDTVSFPSIAEEPGVLEAQGMGHPLLPNGERVCNSFHPARPVAIISGSNLSGKTTFLRTLGINLVLARAGGPVCAASLRCSLYRVATSMRIVDDLGGGVSTFYAELRRIKAIVDAAQEDPSLLFLIDEIFRGTNSEDRLAGAEAVIQGLADRGVRGLITTHDLELCRLADQRPDIANYSFTEHYQGDQVLFDYRIRPGVSRTRNARHLMRLVGIL